MASPETPPIPSIAKDRLLAFAGTISLFNLALGTPSSPREILIRSLAEAPVVYGMMSLFERRAHVEETAASPERPN